MWIGDPHREIAACLRSATDTILSLDSPRQQTGRCRLLYQPAIQTMDELTSADAFYAKQDEILCESERKRRRAAEVDEVVLRTPSFLFRLGRVPVALSLIEYRIIAFLAKFPYRAFTPQQIVRGADLDEQLLNEENLPEHIRTLREKLGMFSDYIQSVPYVGYRFKQ